MKPYSEWRLTSPGGIKHRLVEQGGAFGEESADWRQVIIIRSIDLLSFVYEAFPAPIFTIGGITYPRRFYPAGLPSLKTVGVACEGLVGGMPIDPFEIDSGADPGTYEEFLKVTISFKTCPEGDTPDPTDPFTFLEISGSGSGEYLTAEVSGDSIEWEDEAGVVEKTNEQDAPLENRVFSNEIEWSCKWSQINHDWFHATLLPRLRDLMGKVNSNSMDVLYSAPAETIRFDTWSIDQQYTWRDGFAGAPPVSLQLKFVEKNFYGFSSDISDSSTSPGTMPIVTSTIQVTHNHTWRPNYGWHRQLINGNPTFIQGDLNTIFQP